MSSKSILSNELLEAVSRGAGEEISRLLGQGADPNFRDVFDGGTSLHRAAQRGDPEIVRQLLDHGADARALQTDTASSALGVAVLAGHLETARLLLSRGARLSDDELATGLTEEARQLGYLEIADEIEAGQG